VGLDLDAVGDVPLAPIRGEQALPLGRSFSE
jgi:hypothetical protein